MTGAARSSARPWLVLGAWLVVVVLLGSLGGGIAGRLSATSLDVPGTPSARAKAMLEREFGSSVPVTVLLQGPARAIDRQGPRLVAALRRERAVTVMSPWDSGDQTRSLRPQPRAALIVASFRRPVSAAMSEVVPTAQRIVDASVRPPLRAHVGGVAAVAAALQKDALEATHRAEILVLPVLVIVLLLVFRTPVAAAIPLLMGGATVVAGRGLLVLSTYAMPINSLAVAIASMMGLALGVDYALLMVSRFRQERDRGVGVETAISAAGAAAGRTVLVAGGTLALAMLAAAFVAPGDLLASVAAGVVVAALLSVLLAISLLPALLRVVAPHLDRWRMPGTGRAGRLLDLAEGLVARPWIAIPLILLPMLAVAAPAGALAIGPPDPSQLPRSDPTRQGFEALRRTLGPGWEAPIVVAATARRGAISDPGRLRAISRWQDRTARDPDVEAVIGPASLAEAESAVDRARGAYRTAPDRLAAAQRGVGLLSAGLRRARGGVARLREGLGSAADGAAAIARGSGDVRDGALRLEAGLGRASAGADRLSHGLEGALRGSDRLLAGQQRLGRGAARLAGGARRLDEALRGSLGRVREISSRLLAWSRWIRELRVPTEMAADRLERAMGEVEAMTVGREDPRYAPLLAYVREASALVGGTAKGSPEEAAPALPAGVPASLAEATVEIEGRLARSFDSLGAMPAQIERLSTGIHRLRTGAGELEAGARRTESGGRSLRSALARLSRGSGRLDSGLASARGGVDRLAGGLAALGGGADRLSRELRAGRGRAGSLSTGLAEAQGPLGRYAVILHGYRRQLGALRARSPRAIDSGYLMLTALDGTVPAVREQVAQVVNVEGGGQAVRMLIVPRSGPSAAATRRLSDRLQRRLPVLARAARGRAAIGQGAQTLADYTEATMVRIPLLVLALSLVAIAMLTLTLRSLLLPLIAVALNLLTIAAAFGALHLFFGLGLLVGPRYVDAISAAGVLTIMFVLSIDYEVFLLTRMREAWLRSRDHALAIEHGLRRTAGVITGAAAIMSSVFLAFATADIASLQQFGAGLTFAVALDATVIRVVLLPAIMRAVGPRVWWLPGWLDRRLPHLDADGTAPVESAARAAEAAAPVRALEAVAEAEHREMLAALDELEAAAEGRDATRLGRLARRARAVAEPHFRYEQRALFPQLLDALGPERVERLYADQEWAVEALLRIEALAETGPLPASGAAEAGRLARTARAAVESCEAASDAIGQQTPEVAERVLAARRRVLAAAGGQAC